MKCVLFFIIAVCIAGCPVHAQSKNDSSIVILEDGLIDPTSEELDLIPPAAAHSSNDYVKMPKSWTMAQYLPKAGYQGNNQGSCSAFVVSYGIKTIQENIKGGSAKKDFAFSPAFVFNSAKQSRSASECKVGVTLIQALTVLTYEGTLPFKEFQYYPFDGSGCREKISDKQRELAKKYRISSFDSPELKEEEFKRIISHNVPIAIAVYVDDDFGVQGKNNQWSDTNPFIWRKYSSEKPHLKRHAMLCIGYDRNGFQVFNSWGENFGNKGIFYIPYDFMFRATYQAYIAYERQNPSEDITVRPTGGEDEEVTGEDQQFDNVWFKEGYYRQYGNIRLSNVSLNVSEENLTVEVKDMSKNGGEGVILNRLDFHTNEEKYFKYKGKKHNILFNKIDKEGRNFFSKNFNGKAAFIDYKITNIN